ncbi:HNH endonuclease [Streptomyces sp. NPDC093221]|uniref:HNH endonuclease n=1 Tax=Streptomyces sp. NPDC093221 TaxID=3366032 RepID=UPI003804B7D2
MAPSDVTRTEISRAIEEFDRLGRDAFLRTYGFRRALRYFLLHDGKRYDSKAIVGVAHGYLPGRQPLAPADFSGGLAAAVGVLRALGYTVVEAQAEAEAEVEAEVGAEAASGAGSGSDDNAVLLGAYGELVRRIGRLKVNKAQGAPLLYQPMTLLWALGRAGRGRARVLPWSRVEEELGGLLERRGTRGERARADYPVAALYRAGLWELSGHSGAVPPAHGDATLARWFAEQQPSGGLTEAVYDLLRRSGEARAVVVDTLVDTYYQDVDPGPLLREVGLDDDEVDVPDETHETERYGTGPHEDRQPYRDGQVAEGAERFTPDPVVLAAGYDRLCRAAEHHEKRRGTGRVSTTTERYVRSRAARQAVLERCRGLCENPGCTGQPADTTPSGAAIVEIDHVVDLQLGGRDHPGNMVALCPNCHAVKTRGRGREKLRAVLAEEAGKRHAATLARRRSRGPGGSTGRGD